MTHSTDQVGVFAKYWEPGGVKTRLAASIGPDVAADLHRLFLELLLRRLRDYPARRVLSYTPADRLDEFLELAGRAWTLEVQGQGDLGQRMSHYFDSAFRRGCRRVVLIGSDSPTLPAARIEQAFQRLETERVVLGPSSDGGYYLVGASDRTPDIFSGIAWSTENVWKQTLRAVSEARIPAAVLEPWYDVDTVDDLRRLRVELDELLEKTWPELTSAVRAALG